MVGRASVTVPLTVPPWLIWVGSILFTVASVLFSLVLRAVALGRYTEKLVARMDRIDKDYQSVMKRLQVAIDKQSELGSDTQTLMGKSLICEERHSQMIDERSRVRAAIDELQHAIWRREEDRPRSKP